MSTANAAADVSPSWQAQQMKAFGRWAKLVLSRRSIALNNIERDFVDGIALWHMIDELSQAPYLAPLPHPRGVKDRIQAIDNLNVVFALLKNEGIRAVNVSEVDIADGNVKLTLGLLWILIQKYAIGKVTAAKEPATATVSANSNVQKNALLSQLRDHLKGTNIGSNPLNNFKEAFQDGMVFCALIHKADPKLIDFTSLSPSNKQGNLQLAFDLLEKHFQLPNLLDVDDILSSAPDERSMMTFAAHVFNRLLHPPEPKPTKHQPSHKKGKMQELMGQVGINPEEGSDAHYVPAPLGGGGQRGGKLERSNTGYNIPTSSNAAATQLVASASAALVPSHLSPSNAASSVSAPLTRSVTMGAAAMQPIVSATPVSVSQPTFTPMSYAATPAVQSPVVVSTSPSDTSSAPGIATVQFFKESLSTPAPMNTDAWDVLSKTAITHTALSIQQCEAPNGNIDTLCAAFGEVIKVCRIVAARQEPSQAQSLLMYAGGACSGLMSFCDQRHRGVGPEIAKTSFLEPLQNILRMLKPWFEAQKKKLSDCELATRPISAAVARLQGPAVPTSGEAVRNLAHKAIGFANQIALNMTAFSNYFTSFLANANGGVETEEQRRLKETADRKRAEELRQIDELRQLEEELLEEETQRDASKKRLQDDKAAKALELTAAREAEEQKGFAEAQAQAERDRAESDAVQRSQRMIEEQQARARAEAEALQRSEQLLTKQREEQERQQYAELKAARQQAEEEEEERKDRERNAEMIAARKQAEEEERQRVLDDEIKNLQDEEERKLAEAEAQLRAEEDTARDFEAQRQRDEELRQAQIAQMQRDEEQRRLEEEEDRRAAEAEARRLEALAREEIAPKNDAERKAALSIEASMAAIAMLEQEEQTLRREEEIARAQREAVTATRQRAESQQDDSHAVAQDQAARDEEERIVRQQEEEENRRRQRDIDERAQQEQAVQRRAQEGRRIAEATKLIEDAASQLGVSVPPDMSLARLSQEAEVCMATVQDLPSDAHTPLAQQIVQLMLITRKVSNAVPSGHLLEAARTVAKHACRYLNAHIPADMEDLEEAEQQREISKRGLSFGLQTLIAALASVCSKEAALQQSAPQQAISPDVKRAAEQIEAVAANIGRNPALVAVNFDGIFENIKHHIPALDVQRLKSTDDLHRYVGAVAAVAQATEQVAGIEPEPLRRQQLLDLARSAAAVSIRLLVGEQAAQAENVRALNTTLQALFGLMKAVIHQSGPQADDEGTRMVRDAAERIEKSLPPAPLQLPAPQQADQCLSAVERAIDLADFTSLAPVAAGLLDVAGFVLARRPADASVGTSHCRAFAGAALSFLRLSRRKTTGSLRGQTPSPVALQNEASQLHAWISKSLPPAGQRTSPDMESAFQIIADAVDKIARQQYDTDGSLSDLKDYTARTAAKLDSQMHEQTIDGTPLDKLAASVAKLMDVAVSVATRIPTAAAAIELGKRLGNETNTFLALCKNRKDSDALAQRAKILQCTAGLNAFIQSLNSLTVSMANNSDPEPATPPGVQQGSIRDNPYLEEGLNSLAEGRTRLNSKDTDIEGELAELVAFSAKRRNKLLDVLNERDLDQLDYLRVAELTVEVVETNTALARDNADNAQSLLATGDLLLASAKMMLECSKARKDTEAGEIAAQMRVCLGRMEAEHKQLLATAGSVATSMASPRPVEPSMSTSLLLPPQGNSLALSDSPRPADITPRQQDTGLGSSVPKLVTPEYSDQSSALKSPSFTLLKSPTGTSLNSSQALTPRSLKAANERSGPPDAETLKAIQELVKLTMAELSRVDAPGQKNSEDPNGLYDRATSSEQAMERHMASSNRNAADFYSGTGAHLRELLSVVKLLLNTDAFDDAMKRKRVAEAAKEVGNALFKFTYLKKANDTEGTLDAAQTAISNTLRSLLLQLKPGPLLRKNMSPAAALAQDSDKPVPLTPTPPPSGGSALAGSSSPPASQASPPARNEDVLKSIQEGLRIILEVIEGINGPAVSSPDSTDALVARVEAMTSAVPAVIRVDGSQRTDYVQLAQLVASMIDCTRTVASREDDTRKRQLLDSGRALGNALLKFIYSRKSGAPIDDAQRLLQSFVNTLVDTLRKSTGRGPASSSPSLDPLAAALTQALDVVTEGTNLVEKPLAGDPGRDPQRSLDQARFCAQQLEEGSHLSSREGVITFANNVMSLLDLCRGMSATARTQMQRDKLASSGKRLGQSAQDLLNSRRGPDRRADEVPRMQSIACARELLDALSQSQGAPMMGQSGGGNSADQDAALRTLRVALEVSSERLPNKGKLEMEETCATAEELAAQALNALRQNRPSTRLADLVAELVDLARSLPLAEDAARSMAEQSAAMCRCALVTVEAYPRRNDAPELPTAIRRVVDAITDFARRKKTAVTNDSYMAPKPSASVPDFDLPAKIITEALDKIGKPIFAPYQEEDLSRTGGAVVRILESDGPDSLAFAKAIDALVDAGRSFGALMQIKATSQPPRMTTTQDPNKPRKVGVFKKASQGAKKSRTGWKERLICLRESHIEYYSKPKNPKDYETPNKKDLKGTIELKEAQALESTAIKDKKLVVLELRTPRAKKGLYFVQMPNKDALEDWLRAITAVIEQSTSTRRMTALKPPYEGPLILAETRAIANDALLFVQLVKEREKREQLLRTRNALLDTVKKLASKKST